MFILKHLSIYYIAYSHHSHLASNYLNDHYIDAVIQAKTYRSLRTERVLSGFFFWS